MFSILLSAANMLLGFLVRSVIAKFFLYFGLYFFVTESVGYLQSVRLLPSASSLTSAFGSVGENLWYFLDLCAFSYGCPAVVAAYVTRFVIRRLPIVG